MKKIEPYTYEQIGQLKRSPENALWARMSDVDILLRDNRILIKALLGAFKEHYYCEDSWHSCPKSESGCANDTIGEGCNCGADDWNKYVISILENISGMTIDKIKMMYMEE